MLQIELEFNCMNLFRAGRNDMDVLQAKKPLHGKSLQKDNEVDFQDHYEDEDKFWYMRALFLDKVYQGIKKYSRAVNPIKKPLIRLLMVAEGCVNKKSSSDHIIV